MKKKQRKPSFHGFIGRSRIIKHLTTQLRGAQALGQPCPHLLVIGPSGMGKTRLIQALAQEAGTDCRIIHGKAQPKQLCDELIQMQKGDFLFLDEAHNLPRVSQEALYEVMDSCQMTDYSSVKAQANAQNMPQKNSNGKLQIQPVTVALATNQPSGVLEALHRRMEMTVHIDDYVQEELVEIASAQASERNLLFRPAALTRIAKAGQGQPRKIVQMIKGMKRFFHAEKRQLEEEDVRRYLKTSGCNSLGLDSEQRLYLKKLYKLGRASLSTLSSLIALEEEYVKEKIEPGLLRLALVFRGIAGRELTPAGLQMMNQWMKRAEEKHLRKGKKGGKA